MIRVIAGKEKRPSCLSWWNLSSWRHLFAFLIYFLLIRTIWPSCLKECSLQFWSLPVITSILQPVARGAGRGILSSYSTNPSLLACQAPGAHQQCPWSLCRGKNAGCKVTDSFILWECFYMCKILHTLGFLSLPSRVFGEAAFLLTLRCIFLSCANTKKYSQPLHSLYWFSRQNQKYWMLGDVHRAAWALRANDSSTIHPRSSRFPPISCTDPGSMP